MKFSHVFVVLGLLLATATASNANLKEVEVRGIFENLINSTITKITSALPEIVSISKLPIAFPDEGAITGYCNISNLQITGIKNLVASYIKVEVFSMRLNMTLDLPDININLAYDADSTLANLIPLYGAGKMNIDLENIRLTIAGGVNFTGGIALKDINVGLTLGDAVFNLHGLIDNEDFSAIISSVLTDNVAPFINDNASIISNIISPLIQTIINSILKPSSIQNQFIEAEQLYLTDLNKEV
ncbi:uncharacterized protein LOC109598355 [Aethina tumida]|uniref:uncharacterized protein LOC109598355 n=1 Tax=Aethina tumida TaxID=116153 RepID=UPI002148D6E6|nr:uncharacterized protein LOC109598355 [Aethina tumida]